MDYAELLQAAEESWLYFLGAELKALDFDFIHQLDQQRFTDTNNSVDSSLEYFIISPQLSWKPGDDPETLDLEFPVGVNTTQEPGDVLKAHRRNRELQTVIDSILFSTDRRASGGDVPVFKIPLRTFDETTGEPIEIIQGKELYFQRGEWRNQIPDGKSTRQLWAVTISARVM